MASGLAKNSVENNYLSHSERMEYLDALLSCAESGTNCDVKNELQALSEARDNALIIACQVPGSALCNEQRALALEAQDSQNSHVWGNEYDKWTQANGNRVLAASRKPGAGFDVALVDIHASPDDLQRKLYCSLVGECSRVIPPQDSRSQKWNFLVT